jgi:hypothetical protein
MDQVGPAMCTDVKRLYLLSQSGFPDHHTAREAEAGWSSRFEPVRPAAVHKRFTIARLNFDEGDVPQ